MRTILLAEDDWEMRDFLKESFTRNHFDVIECHNGTQLVKNLSWYSEGLLELDLIISDNRMPDISGMEIFRKIGTPLKEFPPLFLITAFGDEDFHRESLELGAVKIFNKPFEFKDLLEAVNDYLPDQGNQTLESNNIE